MTTAHLFLYYQLYNQSLQCIIPQAVNTALSSWGWAKLSPETCWANWKY